MKISDIDVVQEVTPVICAYHLGRERDVNLLLVFDTNQVSKRMVTALIDAMTAIGIRALALGCAGDPNDCIKVCFPGGPSETPSEFGLPKTAEELAWDQKLAGAVKTVQN